MILPQKPVHLQKTHRLRQAAWFVGLWLAGVASLSVVAWLLRWWLSSV